MRVLRYGVNAVATVAIGVLLARLFVHLPIETPIPYLVQSVMQFFNIDLATHGDDVDGIGLILVFVICLSIAGGIVWILNRTLSRKPTHG